MARLPQITTRDDVAPDHRHIVDSIAESRGRISGPFAMLLHSPEIAGRAAHLGAYIRFNSILEPALRELAIITAAREFDCDYEWGAHEKLARQEGVRDIAIEVIASRGDLDSLSDEAFWRVAASEGGVLVGHGPALRVAHKGGPSTPVTAIGGNGEVTVGYDRASRVGRRETRRFYRP